jgi:hypothetical protein
MSSGSSPCSARDRRPNPATCRCSQWAATRSRTRRGRRRSAVARRTTTLASIPGAGVRGHRWSSSWRASACWSVHGLDRQLARLGPSPSTSSPSASRVGISAPDLEPTTAAWSAESAPAWRPRRRDGRIHLGGVGHARNACPPRIGDELYVAMVSSSSWTRGGWRSTIRSRGSWPTGRTPTRSRSGCLRLERRRILWRAARCPGRRLPRPRTVVNAQDALAIAVRCRRAGQGRVSPTDTGCPARGGNRRGDRAVHRRRSVDGSTRSPCGRRSRPAAAPRPGTTSSSIPQYRRRDVAWPSGRCEGGVLEAVDGDADSGLSTRPRHGATVATWRAGRTWRTRRDLLSDQSRVPGRVGARRRSGAEVPVRRRSTCAVVIGGPVGAQRAGGLVPGRRATIAIVRPGRRGRGSADPAGTADALVPASASP